MMDKKIQLSIYGILAVLFIATSLFITAPYNTISAGTITGAAGTEVVINQPYIEGATFQPSSGRAAQADGSTVSSSDTQFLRARFTTAALSTATTDKLLRAKKQGVVHTISEIDGLTDMLDFFLTKHILLQNKVRAMDISLTDQEQKITALEVRVVALEARPIGIAAQGQTPVAPILTGAFTFDARFEGGNIHIFEATKQTASCGIVKADSVSVTSGSFVLTPTTSASSGKFHYYFSPGTNCNILRELIYGNTDRNFRRFSVRCTALDGTVYTDNVDKDCS